ncbi:MAG: leucyl aminopeptidase [DPANN group archaeon]|nr:leucyl aminopeptidase [DPANN group archaeon]
MIPITVTKETYAEPVAACSAVGIFEGEDAKNLPEDIPSGVIDELKGLMQKKQFTGKLKELRSFTLDSFHHALVVVGLGKRQEYTLERMRKAVAKAAIFARSVKAPSLAFNFHLKDVDPFSLTTRAQEATVAALLALYRFDKYKTEGKERARMKKLVLFAQARDRPAIAEGARTAQPIAEAVMNARDMGNTPANILGPADFEEYARKRAKSNRLRFSVLSTRDLKRKGMDLLVAVGKASKEGPRMIKIEYIPSRKTRGMKKIALVGKGVTFDSGGLNIKPTQWMDYMKSDMCGGADVVEVVVAAKRLGLPHHITGIIPLAENVIGGDAMRPGDVVKGYGGKTVEIMNTDAEGRLILADAVAWAEDAKPDLIIDIATLTGSSIGHLGYEGSPVLGTAEKALEVLEQAGLDTHERIWKMPIWKEFEELIKSDIADLRNLSKPTGREAGVITGGLFMKQFIKKTPWIHIDIGNMSWFPEARDYIPKQASGWGVRLLILFLERFK